MTHLIIPSEELMASMIEQTFNPLGAAGLSDKDQLTGAFEALITTAAQWGADQELEACINHFHEYDTSWGEDSDLIAGLRAARRPKPPSLKVQALEALDEEHADMRIQNYKLIRSVLESLPD